MVLPFYRWCWRTRRIDADTFMRINDVDPPRGYNSKGPRPYSRKQLAALWSALETRYPHTTDLRLLRLRNGTSSCRGPIRRHAMRIQLEAIIELALVCGLRRAEIYNLSVDDVHPDNKYIVVHGKRSDQNPKVRDVPYPQSTRDAIQAWFRMRALLCPEPGLKLWLSVTGPEPAAEMGFHRFRALLEPLGFEFHRLRHTCATERLRHGMKLEELQKFLGHANIDMTLRYAKLLREDIHASAERTDADFQAAIKPHLRRAA
jgi:integrase